MTHRSIRTSSLFLGLGTVMALTGCPGSTETSQPDAGQVIPTDGGRDATTTTEDGGHDAAATMIDAAVLADTGVDTGVDTGSTDSDASTNDAAIVIVDANLAPDMGLASTWDDCGQAVVFGSEGEACSFTGTCVECVLTPAPRTALCMAGHLRVTAAGSGACMSAPDTGMVMFPDAGPRLDAGAGVDGGACNPIDVATPTTAVCPMSVVDCIRAGTDISTCVSANAACLGCVQQDIQACATQTGGCDDEAGRAHCCFDTNCPDGSCNTTTCATPWNAYVACVTATTCTASDACFPASPSCPALTWPAPTAVACSATTATCVDGAATSDTLQACLDADTTTPAGTCGQCFNDGLISCVTGMGMCTSELGTVQCCTDSACPTGDATCINNAVATGGACLTVWNDFFTCVDDALAGVAAGACSSAVGVCLP